MKQHLEVASAVLVVLVIGLAWLNGREEGPAADAASPAALAQAAATTQRGPIPCDTPRPTASATIHPRGGKLKADYAGVYFPHGAYDTTTRVRMTADPDFHAVTLEPLPETPVVVGLRIGYCRENTVTSDYSIIYQDASGIELFPAARLPWDGHEWAVIMVDPDAFVIRATADTADVQPPRGGFVVLSN